MAGIILIILVALWLLGYIHIGSVFVPDWILFHINGVPITLWNILILLVLGWIIGILPFPLKQIAGVLLFLWILSTLGIVAITGLSNILVLIFIVGLVYVLFTG